MTLETYQSLSLSVDYFYLQWMDSCLLKFSWSIFCCNWRIFYGLVDLEKFSSLAGYLIVDNFLARHWENIIVTRGKLQSLPRIRSS